VVRIAGVTTAAVHVSPFGATAQEPTISPFHHGVASGTTSV
jgi:hypothetical protein